jgi:hypothetical protein
MVSILLFFYLSDPLMSSPGQPSNILYSYLHTNFVSLSSSENLIPNSLKERRELPLDTLSARRSVRRQTLPTST